MNSPDERLTLAEAVRLLRRRAALISIVATLITLLSVGLSLRQPDRFESAAEVLVDFQSATTYVDPNGGPLVDANRRLLNNELRFANSEVVLREVAARLGYEPNVSASGDSEDADILTFKAVSGDPDSAAKDVNAYASAYVDARAGRQAATYGNASKAISELLADLQNDLKGLTEKSAAGVDITNQKTTLENQIRYYEQQLNALELSARVGSVSGASVISGGEVNPQRISPRPVSAGLLGLAGGLIIAAGLAVCVDLLSDRIRDEVELLRFIGNTSVLGLVSKNVIAKQGRPSASFSGEFEEGFRSLRTSLKFMSLTRHLHSVQVTSANEAEGKTTVACFLAAAVAVGGQRVVLVDADMRRPSVGPRFELNGKADGLSEVMLGVARWRDVLQESGIPGLSVMTAGVAPGNAADLLSFERRGSGILTVQELVSELVIAGFYVVVDSPPVLPVADALAIARAVDGTLFVVHSGSTRGRAVRRALSMLGRVEARVLGVVLNGVSGKVGRYGYGSKYLTPAALDPGDSVVARRLEDSLTVETTPGENGHGESGVQSQSAPAFSEGTAIVGGAEEPADGANVSAEGAVLDLETGGGEADVVERLREHLGVGDRRR